VSRDVTVLRALAAHRRRLRVAGLGVALGAGAAVAGVVLAFAWMWAAPPAISRLTAIAAFAICASALGAWSWRRWTTTRAAAAVESRHGLDNLVVTAEELASGHTPAVHPAIEAEVVTAALARLETVSPRSVQPLGRPLALGAGAVLALTALLAGYPPGRGSSGTAGAGFDAQEESAVLAAGEVRVVITPPAYTGRDAVTLTNPASVAALEGSRIRLQVSRAARTTLVNLDGTVTAFAEDGEHRALDITAVESRPLLIRFEPAPGASADRLVSLRVHPDERPIVRIEQPAKDLIFPDASGQVAVAIAARDDVGLASLVLRYTKVSGSGETFTFEEGEWPIRIEHAGAGDWTAHAQLSLPALKLEEGDTLVYRAVARDGKPGGDPSLSDSFLIEVGRLAGVASTGFALPEERDRHGISQQMLIIKTERLHADRAMLSEEEFVEQARLLAIEQRMVKAEFEFMTGGVVEDELEEAAHSHELAEGRFENTGQLELITAIREMARAEARLNTADTTQALVHERAALRALQRAFDRRRYLLRTLPERARIDPSRRLSGELDTARSSTQSARVTSADPFLDAARDVLRELEAATTGGATAPALASRMLALEPGSEDLQQAALHVAAARDAAALADAVRDAQRVVAGAIRSRLAKTTPTAIRRDPLAGRLVEELMPGRPQR
jgi:hypothetical protein